MRLLEEFRRFLPSLTDEQQGGLEADIRANGCLAPLVIWGDTLIDGYHRYDICQKHGIKFKTVALEFPSKMEALRWVLYEHRNRRNMPDWIFAKRLLALEPELSKQAKERMLKGKPAPMSAEGKGEVRQKLADVAGIGKEKMGEIMYLVPRVTSEQDTALSQGEKTVHEIYRKVKKHERKEIRRKALAASTPKQVPWVVIPDQAVIPCQAVITDPPYGITEEEWEPQDIEKFTREWAARWNKCGADFIASFCSQEWMWRARQWFDDALIAYSFQQLLVWHCPNNKKPQSRMKFKYTWEPIFLYRRKDSQKTIEPRCAEWAEGINDFDCHIAAVPQSNFDNVNEKAHPAQKPLSVMLWLVGTLTAPGELVCDPFTGSGTTGVAAVQLSRRFHGIETNPEYIKLAKERIKLYGKIIQQP